MPRGLSPTKCNEIEAAGIIPAECRFLNDTIHFCPNWHDALIDDTDPEYERCRCEGIPRAG